MSEKRKISVLNIFGLLFDLGEHYSNVNVYLKQK